MRITLDQVETLRKKVTCDYQTAEKALRKSRGNIDDAILYLKKMENKKYKKAITIIQEIINKILCFNLLIFKNDKKVFNFPVVLLGIIIWILNIPLPIILSVGVLGALSEFSFEIVDRNDNNEYKKTYNSSKPKSYSKQEDIQKEDIQKEEDIQIDEYNQDPIIVQEDYTEDIKSKTFTEQEKQNYDEDGFNEIIIE